MRKLLVLSLVFTIALSVSLAKRESELAQALDHRVQRSARRNALLPRHVSDGRARELLQVWDPVRDW